MAQNMRNYPVSLASTYVHGQMRADKYQLSYVKTTLTEEQIKEYEEWRIAWLNVTKTKEKPIKPIWL